VYDVAILGLGATGSAAAYQAAKRGLSVLGIDQFSPPHAHGSSHGDTRITRKAIGEGDAYVPLVLRANQIWREVQRETGASLITLTGGLWISSGARQAETHVANFFDNTMNAARRYGIEHQVLSAADIRARFPQFAVRDDEMGYYEPDAGFLRPEACIAAQLQLAARRGAELRTGERVERFHDHEGVVTMLTDHGVHRAKQLVICAGPWLRRFLAPEIAKLFTVTRQVTYWFEPEAPVERFQAPAFPAWIWELQDRKNVIYGTPATDAAAAIKVATEQYSSSTTPESVAREVTDAERREMHAQLVAPYLRGVSARCVRAATCLYTATPDFQFVIDRLPGHPNVWLASPCSGHGFKHSAAVGEMLAELVSEGRSTIRAAPFSLERFAAA
jgi:sarcosine oxidase